nr:hypothetical protein [Tanacetum cinerariifolium]
TTAKLITEVVAAVSETVSAAPVVPTVTAAVVPAATVTSAPVKVAVPSTRRRRGVVIRDPEEESSAKTPTETKSKDKGKEEESSAKTPTKTKSKDKGKGIMVEEPKPMKKKQQVELDKAYARKLQEGLNKDIDWEVAMDHVKQKAKENPYNTAGFTLDYFKGMSYDDIRPIFEAKFNANMEFLLKSKEQMEEEENREIALINETLAQKAAKRRRLNKEAKDLKSLNSIWKLCLMKTMMFTQRLLHLLGRRLRKVGTSQRIESSDDTIMEDVSNQGRMINESDKDKGAELMNEKEEKETKEVRVNPNDAQVEGRQADIYHIDMDHATKVLSMHEDEPEIQEAVEVVTTAKLITEVVATVSETVSAAAVVQADVPTAPVNVATVVTTAAPVK